MRHDSPQKGLGYGGTTSIRSTVQLDSEFETKDDPLESNFEIWKFEISRGNFFGFGFEKLRRPTWRARTFEMKTDCG